MNAAGDEEGGKEEVLPFKVAGLRLVQDRFFYIGLRICLICLIWLRKGLLGEGRVPSHLGLGATPLIDCNS